MTLYEYAQEIYETLGSELNGGAIKLIEGTSFKDMVSDDDKCLELIKAVLEFDVSFSYNKNRASHILVTWLLGIGFGKKFGIADFSGAFGKRNANRLWLQTAMIHDYGYFCRELSKPDIDLFSISGRYNLLDDEYTVPFLSCLNHMRTLPDFESYFTYSKQEIEGYFDYSVDFHKNDEVRKGAEKADHGIVGGCVAFNKFCKKNSMNAGVAPEIAQIQKIACYTAASHNIFKSDSEETDEKYRRYGLSELLSTSPIRITQRNLLLLLLSLVDTVECTKRFSKKENPKEFLRQDTTLTYVDVSFLDDGISIDFSRLYDYVLYKRKRDSMARKIESHVEAVVGLPKWTAFKTNKSSNYKVSISI